MITIAITEDYKIIKDIITDPVLYQLTYGQSTELKNYKVKTDFTYLLIKDEEELIGCFQVKSFTNTVLEIHSFILPKFWGTDTVQQAVYAGHAWVKDEGYLKTHTRVPATCVHVLKYLQKSGYKCCGMIEKGIIHNGILVTLFFYEFEV